MQSATSPLVSVVVITYNSADYILDTLNSIKEQTYPRLELIISDDCSTDNTIIICQNWLQQNKSSFEKIQMLSSPVNTGITANVIRGRNCCTGEWVKIIAGDDLLYSNAIGTLISYCNQHPDAKVIAGNIQAFGEDENLSCELTSLFNARINRFSTLSNEELYLEFIQERVPPAPGLFYNLKALTKAEISYDTRIPMINDVPFWISIVKNGIKIHFIKDCVALYRVGSGISTSNAWKSPAAYRSKRLLFFLYQWDYLYQKDKLSLLSRTVDDECSIYEQLIATQKRYQELLHSPAQKIGRIILSPLHLLQRLVLKIKECISTSKSQ